MAWLKRNSSTKVQGAHYEQVAKQFLLSHSLTYVTSNFSCKMGEIDLIMRDNDTLVFVEVKYRRHRQYGAAEEMVNYAKQKRLMKTAFYWLQKHKYAIDNTSFRFDVIAIHEQGNDINWIKNAIVEG